MIHDTVESIQQINYSPRVNLRTEVTEGIQVGKQVCTEGVNLDNRLQDDLPNFGAVMERQNALAQKMGQ